MNKKSGFTLIELLIALVISSIVLVLSSYFFISFTKEYKKYQDANDITFEISTCDKMLKKFEDNVNKNGYDVVITGDYELKYTSYINDVPFITTISYSSITKSLDFLSTSFALDKINNIIFIKDVENSKHIVVKLIIEDTEKIIDLFFLRNVMEE